MKQAKQRTKFQEPNSNDRCFWFSGFGSWFLILGIWFGCPFMSSVLRYYAAACQTDLPNPQHREGIARQVSHMLAMVDRAVVGYAPFFPVRLLVFPEFGHAAPIYSTVDELLDRLAVPIPNDHTERYQQK